jgi:fermentation-respiration switch protein FrsA (DUF1100 family)
MMTKIYLRSIYLFIIILSLSGCQSIRDFLAFFPDVTARDVVQSIPANVKEIYIETQDKERLQCFFVANKSSAKLIIYFQGNAGNIYERLPELIHLAKCGANVLGVGYRGYGKSTGHPSEAGIYLDGDASLDFALHELGYPLNRIYICGRSIGAAVAINMAVKSKLAAIILITPFTNGKEMAHIIGLGPLSFIAGDTFNNLDKVKNIECPALVTHGDKDEVVPLSMGERIFTAINTPKKMVTIKGGHHNDLEDVDAALYWNSIKEIIM